MASSPSLHLSTYRLVRWLPQNVFDRFACFLSAVHIFALSPLSLFLHMPPSSLYRQCLRRKGTWIHSVKEWGSHLLLWFTALQGWMKSKGGGETGALNDFSCGSLKKSHVNMTADSAGSPSRQNHPAATCNSTYYPEREREKRLRKSVREEASV